MRSRAAVIVDRLKLKRQVNAWRVLAILFILVAVLSIFTSSNKVPASASVGSYIARVHIDGPIYHDMDRLEILKQIEENSAIKAVIVHVNSPGGTVVGGETLYDAFLKMSEKKPTVTVMGDVAASGGYMAAIATDYLIAHQSTITGSIGVLLQTYEFSDLADKIGVKFNTFKTSPVKGGPLPTEKMTPVMREEMMNTLFDINDMFESMVKERRKLNDDRLKELADGGVYTGRQALMNGLIDSLGDEDTAVKWLRDVKKVDSHLSVRTIDLYYPESGLGQFFGKLNLLSSYLDIVSSLFSGAAVAM